MRGIWWAAREGDLRSGVRVESEETTALNIFSHSADRPLSRAASEFTDPHEGDDDNLLAPAVSSEPTPEFAAMVAEEYRRLLDRLDNDVLRRVAILPWRGSRPTPSPDQLGCARRTVARATGGADPPHPRHRFGLIPVTVSVGADILPSAGVLRAPAISGCDDGEGFPNNGLSDEQPDRFQVSIVGPRPEPNASTPSVAASRLTGEPGSGRRSRIHWTRFPNPGMPPSRIELEALKGEMPLGTTIRSPALARAWLTARRSWP